MDTFSRAALTIAWLTIVTIVAVLAWQVDVLGRRSEQRDCWAADQRIAISGLEFQVLIEQGAISDADATAALEEAAAELRQTCPDYRAPLAGTP